MILFLPRVPSRFCSIRDRFKIIYNFEGKFHLIIFFRLLYCETKVIIYDGKNNKGNEKIGIFFNIDINKEIIIDYFRTNV